MKISRNDSFLATRPACIAGVRVLGAERDVLQGELCAVLQYELEQGKANGQVRHPQIITRAHLGWNRSRTLSALWEGGRLRLTPSATGASPRPHRPWTLRRRGGQVLSG